MHIYNNKHKHVFHIVPAILVAFIFIFNYFHTFANYYYVGQFGSEGTGNGQFSYPRHIAKDSVGNFYVVDRSNNRVQKFNSNGIYISQFGTIGSGDGQMYGPDGIAVDSLDNVYIADTLNYRIQKFDSNGNYISQFGTYGTSSGKFKSPVDLTIDASGNIYVLDSQLSTIQKFDSSGGYVSQFGSKGSGDGQFNFPFGIKFNGDKIFVADTGNNRIQVFDTNGAYVTQFGTYGEAPGGFLNPVDFAFSSVDNSIYIVDSGLSRVQKFDSSYNFLYAFSGPGPYDGRLSAPVGIVLGANDDIYVVDQNMHRVQIFSSSPQVPGAPQELTFTSGNATATVSFVEPMSDNGSTILYYTITSVPGGITATTTATSSNLITGLTNGVSYNFYVSATNAIGTGPSALGLASTTPRDPVLFGYKFDSYFGSTTLQMYEVSPDGVLASPSRTSTDNLGNVYILDPNNQRIQKFDSNGNFLLKFGVYGSGDGEFSTPSDLSTAINGFVYVVDSNNHRVEKFDSDGNYLSQFGTNGSGDGEFAGPSSIFIDKASSTIYIADTYNGRVQKFDLNGNYISQFGTNGSGDGEFNQPKSITRIDNNIYVVDAGNHRVQIFDMAGNYISQFGTYGSGNGEFASPEDIELSPNGDIYVTDQNRVQRLHKNGEYVTEYQVRGNNFGAFGDMSGIYIDNNTNFMFLADKQNNIVQKFTPFEVSTSTPSEPRNVVAVASDASAVVKFDAPTSDGGAAITEYVITSTPGSIIATTSVAASTTINGLTNDTSYTFVVNAINSVGRGATSTPSNSVTPTAPTTPTSLGVCPAKGKFIMRDVCLCPNGKSPTEYDIQERRHSYNQEGRGYYCELEGGFIPISFLPAPPDNNQDNPVPVGIQEILVYESWPPQNEDLLKNNPKLKGILIQNSLFIKNYKFKKNLSFGDTHNDVKSLQMFLNIRGYILARSGAGSIGNETKYFGNATKQALIKFQKANKIYPANGNFGPVTREFVNKILEVRN